ncbi:globin-coupled sensor protein [Mesorhizobium sp. KR1-2]|uniref:globin-coupled sensor protein n=1 Tax=Mesorhizobium sp. KR1-2 TaxID=3156609 RepID=UPI0032B54F56
MAHSTGGQGSLNERLHFIGMDQKARETLSSLQPLLGRSLGPALTAFYEKVKATPETRSFFGDDKHMASAKSRQEQHWQIIAEAHYNDDYLNAVLKVGQTHARIGLEPRWYVAGYALVLEQLIHAVVKERWPSFMAMAKRRPEGMAETLSCLVKAAMLDMDLAISVYLETLDEQRRKAEEAGQEALRQERSLVANSIGVGLAKLAAKDLSYRIEEDMPEAYRKLQSDFNAAIEQLEGAMQSVAGSTNAIQSGTQEMAVAADDLSRRTEQQAASLEETAAALDQLTATVKKSAEGAAHARQVVVTADEDAKQSALVVRQAVEAMDAISKSARQINQIIGVIDEIAFQTNLLALNAGVEAARAGDAGRGFAVVASEVRALAQRSAEAAKEIKNLISDSTTQVEGGVKLVVETGKSLERILAQVADINNVVSDIASGAQEQAAGLDQVNTAINHMDQATQQNAAMVEESTAATHSLSHETGQLAELIGQFQVGRSGGDDYIRRELKKVAPHVFRSVTKPPAARGVQR